MPPVFHHARKNIPQFRLPLSFAMPFHQYGCGYFNVSPLLLRRVATQKQAIKKSGLALWWVDSLHHHARYELCHRRHKENAVYPKAAPRQVGLPFFCRLPVTPRASLAISTAVGTLLSL